MDLRPPENRQLPLLCLLLVALTFAVYWPVRLNEFINYDDQEYVTQNPEVRQGLTWEGIRWAFRTSRSANWHPLTWLSHMLDCQLFGLSPAGHHLTGLAFHLANVVLLFLLFQRATGALGRSAFVAGLFAVHPLHVESVAWVAERKDVLSTFFGLLSLLGYVTYAKLKSQGAQPKALRHEPLSQSLEGRKESPPPATSSPAPRASRCAVVYALSLLLYAFSLLSKPMLVTLPFLLVLLDYWPLRRLTLKTSHQQLPVLVEKLPFAAFALLSCAVTLHVQRAAMSYYQHLAFPARAANAVVAYARYLAKTVWPHDLAVFYPHPTSWPAAYVLAVTLLLIFISTLAIVNWHRRPYLGVGWFWFCGTLVPVLGLVQVGAQSIADRYTYLPLVGIFIVIAWFGVEAGRTLRLTPRVGRVVATLLLLACAVGTRLQLTHWRDTEAIFEHAIAVTRDNWVAHYNLALLALSRYQDTQRSGVQQQLLTAPAPLGAKPSSERDYLQEVIDHCEATLRAKPGFPDPHVTLAKALTERGQLDAARPHLELAVRLAPQNPDARQDLAELLSRQGQVRAAVAEYKAALALRPDWDSVLNNLAWLLATCPEASVRDGREAVRLAKRASSLSGDTNLWFLHTLAAAYAEAGEFTNAVAAATAAQKLAAATGQPDLAATATTRLELYRAGQPLRAP